MKDKHYREFTEVLIKFFKDSLEIMKKSRKQTHKKHPELFKKASPSSGVKRRKKV